MFNRDVIARARHEIQFGSTCWPYMCELHGLTKTDAKKEGGGKLIMKVAALRSSAKANPWLKSPEKGNPQLALSVSA
jgi:hypothetical protein